ncbi:MAG: phenylacetate--CoA ligase family protein, partial [Deltaproteobacteria bacterium]|nr:phenylacetate--CoA ligase family protein [Deltaproteobacteria bacterium]
PRQLKRLADLQAIPVTTRERLQETPSEELISRTARPGRLHVSRTSGSTGTPVALYRTRQEAWLRRFLTLRTFFYNGLRWTDRVVTISRRHSGSTFRWFQKYRASPALWNIWFHERPEAIIRELQRFQPTVIYGFASNLAIIADLMLRGGVEDVRPRLLVTSSDLLTAGYRRLLARAFHSQPLDLYNCTELGDVAWECQRRKGLHVNADWLCVEVLRAGEPVGPGGTGEVVVTPLYRYAMPLIRYSPGDIATFAQDPCPCGVTLPMLSQLEGRSQNVVPLPGGRYFAGFSEIMSHYPEIKRYQIVQTALDAFTVRVVPGHGYSPQVSQSVVRVMTERLGNRIRVDVSTVDESELGARRKSLTVIPLHPVALGSDL